jgi:hypothetical protein
MIPKPLYTWDHMQLVMLRLLVAGLAVVDRLFNVRWGEHVLERLAARWQARLTQLDQALAYLEEERHKLQLKTEALALHTAAIYLGGRSVARDGLCFDPADPHDEELLDATIDLLVKERLAAIEPEEMEEGHFVYHLEPDWPAIRTRLARATDEAEPETAEWFREGLMFIDETFLSETAT